MNKKYNIILALLLALSLCACTSESQESKVEKEEIIQSTPEQQLEVDKNELSKIGEVEVDEGTLYVSLTIPASNVETSANQTDLNQETDKTYSKVTINDDGSVTYKMTKEQYMARLKVLEKSFEEATKGLLYRGDLTYKEIEHDDNYTNWNITLGGNTIGIGDYYTTEAFFAYGFTYQLYTGTKEPVVVNYYNNEGKLIDTYTSSDFNKYRHN